MYKLSIFSIIQRSTDFPGYYIMEQSSSKKISRNCCSLQSGTAHACSIGKPAYYDADQPVQKVEKSYFVLEDWRTKCRKCDTQIYDNATKITKIYSDR